MCPQDGYLGWVGSLTSKTYMSTVLWYSLVNSPLRLPNKGKNLESYDLLSEEQDHDTIEWINFITRLSKSIEWQVSILFEEENPTLDL